MLNLWKWREIECHLTDIQCETTFRYEAIRLSCSSCTKFVDCFRANDFSHSIPFEFHGESLMMNTSVTPQCNGALHENCGGGCKYIASLAQQASITHKQSLFLTYRHSSRLPCLLSSDKQPGRCYLNAALLCFLVCPVRNMPVS